MNTMLKKVAPAWRAFERATHIGPIRDEAHYDEMTALCDALIDEIGEDASHALNGLLYIVGDLIRDHDERHRPIPDVTPVGMLQFLMEQHDLTQCDLPEVGTQSVVSAVLSGKRKLNARQIVRLAKRFNLPADVFLEDEAGRA